MKEVKLKNIKMAGISVICSNDTKSNYQLIRNCWQLFNNELHKIKNRLILDNWEKFGIIYDSNKKDQFTYMAAIEVQDFESLPEDFNKIEIEESVYKVFKHKGPLSELSNRVYGIFRNELPQFGDIFIHNGDLKLSYFEKYDKRFNWNKKDSVLDIYVPIIFK